jgi:hypothetical protein
MKANLINIYIGTPDIAQKRRESYETKAKESGLTLSTWARKTLDACTNFKGEKCTTVTPTCSDNNVKPLSA